MTCHPCSYFVSHIIDIKLEMTTNTNIASQDLSWKTSVVSLNVLTGSFQELGASHSYANWLAQIQLWTETALSDSGIGFNFVITTSNVLEVSWENFCKENWLFISISSGDHGASCFLMEDSCVLCCYAASACKGIPLA